MTEYSKLNEGVYKKDFLREEQIWKIFIKIFNVAESVKVASYKFGLIYSILKCLQVNENHLKFAFRDIFTHFTQVYWKLIVNHQLFQISSKTLSSIYNILINYIIEHPNFRNGDFVEILTDDQEKILNKVVLKCSRNVFGALFGDSEEFFYSFNKKEGCIELNPLFSEFLTRYGNIIEKANNYEWLKFLHDRNSGRAIDVLILENKFKHSNPLNFEELWVKIQKKFEPPITIFTLKQHKANEILEINDNGILVKTEKGNKLVNSELIKKAWKNLVNDGVLYRDEHEKSTYRSSFILSLLSQFDFIDANSKGRLSIRLTKA
ncbi:hypothetical protein LCGC14_0564570 [marine sediment metagenome]|uniref:Uncharacterized protein n=1 Tax=marine sediment metagenome TaxID=412755 RepID=A0A0F9U7G0_9ZZZZ